MKNVIFIFLLILIFKNSFSQREKLFFQAIDYNNNKVNYIDKNKLKQGRFVFSLNAKKDTSNSKIVAFFKNDTLISKWTYYKYDKSYETGLFELDKYMLEKGNTKFYLTVKIGVWKIYDRTGVLQYSTSYNHKLVKFPYVDTHYFNITYDNKNRIVKKYIEKRHTLKIDSISYTDNKINYIEKTRRNYLVNKSIIKKVINDSITLKIIIKDLKTDSIFYLNGKEILKTLNYTKYGDNTFREIIHKKKEERKLYLNGKLVEYKKKGNKKKTYYLTSINELIDTGIYADYYKHPYEYNLNIKKDGTYVYNFITHSFVPQWNTVTGKVKIISTKKIKLIKGNKVLKTFVLKNNILIEKSLFKKKGKYLKIRTSNKK